MSNNGAPAQPLSPADSHDFIRVTSARENNLRGCDVVIPKRRLTVFTGVSGSGKSSLVFSTIAAEARRLINETYPSFVQGFMPSTAHPDVDSLEGLTPAIIVDQERLCPNPRSTLGTCQRPQRRSARAVLPPVRTADRWPAGLCLQRSFRHRWRRHQDRQSGAHRH